MSYFQVVFPDDQNPGLNFAFHTRQEAEEEVELHQEYGDLPWVEERPGTLVRGRYGDWVIPDGFKMRIDEK